MLRILCNRSTGPPSLALLAAVTALAFCALHMVVPALPLLAGTFHDRAARVQLILSLYLAGIAGGQLVYGPLSDRFGRRPVLVAGLAMFLLGTALCSLAPRLDMLIFGRALAGFGACAGVVLARAIIRDVYEREAAARGLALVMMAMTLAPAASPALGAALVEWVDWRAIFVLLEGLGAIVFVAVLLRLGETNRTPAPLNAVRMAEACVLLLRDRRYVAFALCSACTSAAWFTFVASAPHLLADMLGEPPSTYGLMILMPMTTYMLGNALAARFALRVGSLDLLLWGRLLAFAGAAVLGAWFAAAGAGAWALFLPVALTEIGDGLTQPSAMAAALSIRPRIAGTASGLIGFMQMTTAALGSFVVALLPQNGRLGPVAVFAGLVALSLGFAILAVRRRPAVVPAAAVGGAN